MLFTSVLFTKCEGKSEASPEPEPVVENAQSSAGKSASINSLSDSNVKISDFE